MEAKIQALFKNKWTWVGLGTGGLGIIYYFHKRNEAAAAAAATSTTATDSTDATTDSTDDSDDTDDSYGDDSGYSPVDSEDLGGYGVTPSDYEYDPSTGEYEYTGTVGTTVGATTNAEWVQQASAQLQSAGYTATAIDLALGKYILGDELTSDQYSIVQAAIGVEGPTPEPVPQPKVASSSTTSTVTSLAAPHVTQSKVSSTLTQLSWTKVTNANSYWVYDTNGSRITSTTQLNTRVSPPTKTTYFVIAVNGKVNSPKSNEVSVTPPVATKKK